MTIGAGLLTTPIPLPPLGITDPARPPEPPAITAEQPSDAQPDERLYAQDALRLVNQQREAHGCKPLAVNAAISIAAEEHSRDIGVNGYFAHNAPSGETPWSRMQRAGYAEPAAENIAMGYRTPREVVDGWMSSPDHRANILNCSYKATGIGYYDGASAKPDITDATVNNPSTNGSTSVDSGPWWTEDFGYA